MATEDLYRYPAIFTLTRKHTIRNLSEGLEVNFGT